MLLLLATAFAGDLTFAPDRPGVGESTATPGAGHVLIEAGFASAFDPVVGGASIMGRVGVLDDFEVRVWAPGLSFSEDGAALGNAGIGFKVAHAFSKRTTFSVVPEFFAGDGYGLVVGLNLAVAFDAGSFWAHVGPSVAEGAGDVLVGGGMGLSAGAVSPFIHVGAYAEGSAFVGGGAAITASDAIQVDLGVDVVVADDQLVPVAQAGVAFGF